MITTGWWFQPTPLKNDGVKVTWDDENSQYHGKVIQNSMVPATTNQTTFGPSNLTPLDTEKENTATWDDLS